MKPTLENELRPASRSATSLGRLVACCVSLPQKPELSSGKRSRLWTNRPGQDRAETFTLAALIALTVAGLVAGWLIRELRPESPTGWLMVAALLVPGFFLVLHLLIFAASAIDCLIRWTGIRLHLPPGHFCGRLFLGLLTALCGIELANPDAGAGLKLIAAGWIALAGLNAVAWLGFCARDLFRNLCQIDPA